MAVPPVVDLLTNLQNESSAVTKINQNAQRAADAISRVLSTSDTSQNTMNIPLDMNGQTILNLPAPSSPNGPVRSIDLLNNNVSQNAYFLQLVTALKTGPQGPQGLPGNVNPIVIPLVDTDYIRPGPDDTNTLKALFAAAVNANGQSILLTKNIYTVSDSLILNGNCVSFAGRNAQGTIIQSTALDRPIIRISGVGQQLQNIQLNYTGTPTSGATALSFENASNPMLSNVIIGNGYIGLSVIGGSGFFANNLKIFNPVQVGFLASNTVDIFVCNFIFNAGNTTNAALGNIRFFQKVEAANFVNGDILLGAFAHTSDATTNAANSRPGYNKFIGVYFDSASNGVYLNNTVLTSFTNCWFSAGRTGTGIAGCTLSNCDSISFNSGTQFFNNGGHGLQIKSTTKRTIVTGCNFESNNVSGGAGAGHGIFVEPNTTHFIITGNTASNLLYPGGNQYFFINVAAGSSDKYTIRDNLITGNGDTNTGINDGGTGTNKRVQDNWI